MTARSKRTVLVNILGTLGYISLALQWLWTAVVVGYPLLEARPTFLFPKPAPTPDPASVPVIDPVFSPIITVVAIAITVAVLIFSVIIVAKLPSTVGRQGAKLTKATAESLVPIVTDHKKISQKKRIKLSYRLTLVIKLLLLVVPLGLLLFARPIESITLEIIWVIGLFTATCTLLYFVAQALLVRLFKVPTTTVW